MAITHKIYSEENYLFIDNLSSGQLFDFSADEVKITRNSVSGSLYAITHNCRVIFSAIRATDIAKRNGDAYTLEEFEAWRLKYSGEGVPEPEIVIGATLIKTGQNISYLSGDDGDLMTGREVDFSTLLNENPFGNTNRFTDELGNQLFTNEILIDWSTFNGETVLGWKTTPNAANIKWEDAKIEAESLIVSTYTSGWRLPNRIELDSIRNQGTTLYFNYFPFAFASNFRFWTSNTWLAATTYAICLPNRPVETSANIKTTDSNMRYFACRTFTVDGTTLS